MFGFDYFDITAEEFERYVNKIVDKKLKETKVRIPQEQINNAVVKFFTEKKWFLTEDGKKLDTYDLIRKFAMNTIGVGENGELNPEMLKVVQEEVAKIIADTYFNDSAVKDGIFSNTNINETDPCGKCACNCGSDEDEEEDASEHLIKSDKIGDAVEESYRDGYTDGTICTVNTINEILKEAGINDIHFYWDDNEIMLSDKRNRSVNDNAEPSFVEESIEIDPKLINEIVNKLAKILK
jgi:hypothetical protein